VVGQPEFPVDGGDVEVQLTQVLRLELLGLQFDNDVPAGGDVEQEKVDEELVVAHGEAVLAADESEPGPELCQGLRHPQRHSLFHGLLVGFLPEAEEVQHERVFGDFSGQVGALPREAGLMVARRGAGALVEAAPEVVLEDGSGPAVLDSLRHVPLPCGSVVELVDEDHDVAPRQLVSSC
jgi:hypothetical protein